MNPRKQDLETANVLEEVAVQLRKGAAGPTDYWFKKLAARLNDRAHALREIPNATDDG